MPHCYCAATMAGTAVPGQQLQLGFPHCCCSNHHLPSMPNWPAGVAIFGGLFDRSCGAALEQCTLSRNTLSGLLVRDGASPAVGGCTLSGNGEWGLLLQDAGGSYLGCEIVANARGSVAYSLLDDGVDTAMMVVYNKLDRPVQSLGRV